MRQITAAVFDVPGLFALVIVAISFTVGWIGRAKEKSFGKKLGQELKDKMAALQVETNTLKAAIEYINKDREQIRTDLSERLDHAQKERERLMKEINEKFEHTRKEREIIKEDLADLEDQHDILQRTLFNKFLK